MGTPHKITEARLRALVLRLYIYNEQRFGPPKQRVHKHVYIGNLESVDGEWCMATTTQVLNKSFLCFSQEFIGSRHIQLLHKVAKHEFAHVWAGTEHDHNSKEFKKWAKRFDAPIYFY